MFSHEQKSHPYPRYLKTVQLPYNVKSSTGPLETRVLQFHRMTTYRVVCLTKHPSQDKDGCTECVQGGNSTRPPRRTDDTPFYKFRRRWPFWSTGVLGLVYRLTFFFFFVCVFEAHSVRTMHWQCRSWRAMGLRLELAVRSSFFRPA